MSKTYQISLEMGHLTPAEKRLSLSCGEFTKMPFITIFAVKEKCRQAENSLVANPLLASNSW